MSRVPRKPKESIGSVYIDGPGGLGQARIAPLRYYTMLPSADIEAALGIEEADILRAIREHPGDVESIHVMTGIPRPCIEVKVAALVELGYVMRTPAGYEAVVPPTQDSIRNARHPRLTTYTENVNGIRKP